MDSLDRELYFLILHFLQTSPCKQSAEVLKEELSRHKLLPRCRHHTGAQYNATYDDVLYDNLGLPHDQLSRVVTDNINKERVISLLYHPITDSLSQWFASQPTYLLSHILSKMPQIACLHPIRQEYSIAEAISNMTLAVSVWGHRSTHEPGIPAHCMTLAFDPSGSVLVTGGEDQLVKVWDTHTGLLAYTIRGHEGEVLDVCFHPDSHILATTDTHGVVRVWRLYSDSYLPSTVITHDKSVPFVKFLKTNREEIYCGVLVTVTSNSVVRIFEVQSLIVCKGEAYTDPPVASVDLGKSTLNAFSVAKLPDYAVASVDLGKSTLNAFSVAKLPDYAIHKYNYNKNINNNQNNYLMAAGCSDKKVYVVRSKPRGHTHTHTHTHT
eukprot:GHVR01182100.1.p1 GENE.GHVR01182100.1~~GHVR01182100.1.p1  ORF type:complete len:381 (+),score=104.78 GHVR01182100.1:37-1179(+)